MIRLAQRILKRFGLELRRIPPEAVCGVAASEISRVEEVLKQFASTQSPGSDLADFQALRGYLSNARLSFFHSLIQTVRSANVDLDQQRVADVGCGTGYLLRLIGDSNADSRLYGFDTFAAMNDLARALCPTAQIFDKSFDDIEDQFDVVFCTEVLEHLVAPDEALQKLMQLAGTGTLILTVPNGRIDQQAAGEPREDGTAYWGHVNFWSPESWQRFLTRHAPESASVATYILPSGENVGIIRHHETVQCVTPKAFDSSA